MNKMVERVAQAMMRDVGATADMSDPYRRVVTLQLSSADFVGMAIAAIKAMREPTAAMIDAGKHVAVSVLAQSIKPEQIQALIYTGIDEWRAMIAAALADPDDA